MVIVLFDHQNRHFGVHWLFSAPRPPFFLCLKPNDDLALSGHQRGSGAVEGSPALRGLIKGI